MASLTTLRDELRVVASYLPDASILSLATVSR
jgi:hypothetical protein